MTASEAAYAMAQGIRRVLPQAQCVQLPLADGGEGFTQALTAALGATPKEVVVQNPLGDEVRAQIAVVGSRAIVEVAEAIGLGGIPRNRRNILQSSSYGVGQLISAALDAGATEILVGLGGSATNDGGAGMLRALGVRFFDAEGTQLSGSPESLACLAKVDTGGLDRRLSEVEIKVACDVANPLLGSQGASAIFGPQKGASPADVEFLDQALTQLSEVGGQVLGTARVAGAGAAGGLGYAFLTYLDAQLASGIDIVLEAVGFEEALAGADYVFTGEGAIDKQTLMGKTLGGVAALASKAGVPVVGFAGRVSEDAAVLYEHGFMALMPIVQQASTLEEALKQGANNLADAAERTTRLLFADCLRGSAAHFVNE